MQSVRTGFILGAWRIMAPQGDSLKAVETTA